jgi:hypothetical protein
VPRAKVIRESRKIRANTRPVSVARPAAMRAICFFHGMLRQEATLATRAAGSPGTKSRAREITTGMMKAAAIARNCRAIAAATAPARSKVAKSRARSMATKPTKRDFSGTGR